LALQLKPDARLPRGLVLLVVVQVFCAVFFITDALSDYRDAGRDVLGWHRSMEALATLTLCIAIAFEVPFILRLLRRKAHLERSMSVARAAMHDVIEAHFGAWGLTPAEADVAMFLVKGLGIAEIAALRGSAEGTVKSHLNAIYRKSGTSGRGELLSLILDGVIDGGGSAADA
jgi:DNA-binding CsgD family transcriptional regulator